MNDGSNPRGTPSDRWQCLDELFAAALELPLAQRGSFLDQACGDDPELRSEVESLLAHHREDGFLDLPGVEWASRVVAEEAAGEELVGRRLGRFEVLASLGGGGMGEVYLAHDPSLSRRVALKLLSPRLVDDPERIRRFRREAVALSALNHPNILTVYEITEVEGRQLLVCELVDGVTLRERLRKGPLPVAAALDVAQQIARALAAAHGVGIVHRDVTPENVMIRRDGLVKLLDFGIARSLESPAPGSDPAALWSTEAGMILGTAAYMSPEQARGEAAGAQTDIWALGCVLYEALTGRRAFPGKTVSDVLAAILTREPDWEQVPAEVPFLARSLLRRCLQKRPEQRLHDVADARLELEEAMGDPVAGPASASSRRRPGWLPWSVAALASAAALVVVLVTELGPPARAPGPSVRFELPHPAGGRFYYTVEAPTLAMSADGSQLAFITLGRPGPARSIWVRPLAELVARPVPGTEGAISLFWSPDGHHLGFVANGKLKRVPVAAGGPVVLCDVEAGSGVSGTWAGDSILFTSVQGDTIYRVPSSGGSPTVVLRAEAARDENRLVWPWLLPDGERFLYLTYHGDGSSELRLAGPRGESRAVAPMASRVEFVDPDYLVFTREGELVAQRFDTGGAELFGAPLSLASSVRVFGSTGAAAFATARQGTVVAATQDDLARLTLLGSGGQTLSTFGDAITGQSVRVSSDGRRAIIDRLRPGLATYDLWVLDLERGVESRLTDAPGTEVFAAWLPGDQAIVYSSTRGSVPNLLRRDLATGNEKELVPLGPFQIAAAATPDGRQLLFRQRTASGFQLLAVALDDPGPPVPVLRPGIDVWDAVLSPDGRVLAYISPEAGRPELFVRLLAGGESLRVSEDGAWTARFAPEGGTLFFTTSKQRLAAVAVATEPALTVGTPVERFELPELSWLDFAVLRDGRFLALVREVDGTVAPLTVITGWNGDSAR